MMLYYIDIMDMPTKLHFQASYTFKLYFQATLSIYTFTLHFQAITLWNSRIQIIILGGTLFNTACHYTNFYYLTTLAQYPNAVKLCQNKKLFDRVLPHFGIELSLPILYVYIV